MNRAASYLMVSLLLSGCAVQPWVKPYERGKLSDAVMSPLHGPLMEGQRQRLFATQEGARGVGGFNLTGNTLGDR